MLLEARILSYGSSAFLLKPGSCSLGHGKGTWLPKWRFLVKRMRSYTGDLRENC